MNQSSYSIIYAFSLAIFCTLFGSALLPHWSFNWAAPALIVALYRFSWMRALWTAFGMGLLLDLASSDIRLGVHALACTSTLVLLRGQTRSFFEDSLSTIPILTFFFSMIQTVVTVAVQGVFGQRLAVSSAWIGTDLILFPLLDGLMAFVFFALPLRFMDQVFPRRRRIPGRPE